MERICRKLFKSKPNKKNEGITLIALVITVVVMLILAGVTIVAIVYGDGLFSKTRQATEIYNNSANDEKSKINEFIEWIDNHLGSKDIKLSYKKTNIDEYSTKIDLKTEISDELLTPLTYEEYAQKILSGITSTEEKENLIVETFNYDLGNNYNYISIEDVYNEIGCNSLEELSSQEGYSSVDEMLIGEKFVKPQGYDFENNRSKPILYVNGILEKDYGADTLESYIYIASTNGDYVFTVVVGNMSKSITVNVDELEKIEYKYVNVSESKSYYAIDTKNNLYYASFLGLGDDIEVTKYTNTHIKMKRVNSDIKVKEVIEGDYILGQDNKLYKYDNGSDTLILQLDGLKFSKVEKGYSDKFLLSENGEVYEPNGYIGSIEKLDFDDLYFKDICEDLGLATDGAIYDLDSGHKVSGDIVAKDFAPSSWNTYFISEDEDLYCVDYENNINLISNGIKFEKFYNEYAVTNNGEIYMCDDNDIIDTGINVDNVKNVTDVGIVLKDGSIYVKNSSFKSFENIVNTQNINVKVMEHCIVIDESNNVYVYNESKGLEMLDIKGKDVRDYEVDKLLLIGMDNKVYSINPYLESTTVDLINEEEGYGYTDLNNNCGFGLIWLNENNIICYSCFLLPM